MANISKKDKIKTLRENGWTDLWHPNNWVKKEWFDNPKINIDWAGISLDKAYDSIVASKKNNVIRSMMRNVEIYKQAITVYGETKQMDMMIEEMSELTQAICKYKRKGDVAVPNLMEEIADVWVMLNQMLYMFNRQEVLKIKNEKLNKLKNMLDNHGKN